MGNERIMKLRKLEIKIRSTRPGVPAEEMSITNVFSEEEAKRRWREIVPILAKLAEDHMGWPNCGACPGDGSVCKYECKVAAESPPISETNKELYHP